nr:M50 family metallopeptidase [Micromonospora sp. DSM 115978]
MSTAVEVPGPHDLLPRVRPDIVLGAPLRRGEGTVHFVKDPLTGWFYQLGAREFFLLSTLDGRRSRAEVESAYAERFGRRLTVAHWSSLLAMLHRRRLLLVEHPAGGDADLPPGEVRLPAAGDGTAGRRETGDAELAALRQQANQRRRAGRRRLWYARFPIVNPDPFLGWLAPRVGALYSPWFVVPALLAAAAALAVAVGDAGKLYAASRMNIGHPLAVVSFVTTWLVIAAHEVAHGLTCRRFGGSAPEIGVLWRFPLLTPYCKTDDVVLFARRRHRVYTAFAGVFVNLVALVPFAASWLLIPPGGHAHALAGSLLFYGTLTVALNLLPVLRLDGYFMLNHAAGMLDLRRDTWRFWGALLARRDLTAFGPADRLTHLLYGLTVALSGGALLATMVSLWYFNLSRWLNGPAAVAILATEAVLVVLLARHLLRRRASRAAAPAAAPAAAGDHR